VSYTLSSAIDDVSDVFGLAGASALPQNSLTFAGERNSANFDTRHRLSYSFIYDFPEMRSRLAKVLVGDMQVSGTGRLSTGQPFTVNSTFDVNLDGNLTDRLNTTNGIVSTGNRQQPYALQVNPSTLLAPVGSDGAIKRNSFRATGMIELDFGIRRQLSISTGTALIIGAEVFNSTNRVNYAIPVRFLEAPGFGSSTKTITPGRRVMLSLKYSF
jgi:hypothetical protein